MNDWAKYEELRAAIMDAHREASERIMRELQPLIDEAQRRGDGRALERIQRRFVASMEPYSRMVARQLAKLPVPPIKIDQP